MEVKDYLNQDNKLFHSYVLTAYGEAFYKAQRYKEAEEQLERALNLQEDH